MLMEMTRGSGFVGRAFDLPMQDCHAVDLKRWVKIRFTGRECLLAQHWHPVFQIVKRGRSRCELKHLPTKWTFRRMPARSLRRVEKS